MICATEICANNFLPILFLHHEKSFIPDNAGIVNNNVYPAEFLNRLFDYGAALFIISYIGLDREEFCIFLLNLLFKSSRIFSAFIVRKDNVCPLVCKSDATRLSYPTRAAGYDNGFIIYKFHDVYFSIMQALLCPPGPKDVISALLIFFSLAVFGTQSIEQAGSASEKFIVGGIRPLFIAPMDEII